MRVYGSAAMSDLLGDMVAYRSLRPIDPRLPGLADLAPALGLAPDHPPRKGSDAYAHLVAGILRAARALKAPGATLRQLLLIGDTRGSDGGAFASLCATTGWKGRAFICEEQPGAAPAATCEGPVVYANRWSMLHSFSDTLDDEAFGLDTATVVLLDLDKTLLGARGRNDRLIDEARRCALRASVAELLGDAFDQAAFEEAYRTIDQPGFHPLTADNQDYVAYVCLMVVAGVIDRAALLDLCESGGLPNFAAFVALAGRRVDGAAPRLAGFHAGIARLVAAGDPTPFKAFRQHEYRETIARMGCGRVEARADQLLREELALTAEVWAVSWRWSARGALLFGLSDKPDEAAIPPPDMARRGEPPLHQARTHVIGQ